MNLKKLRNKAGLTALQLSEKSGVNIKTISSYESGANELKKARFTIILQLCIALNCKFSDLFKDDEEVLELINKYKN